MPFQIINDTISITLRDLLNLESVLITTYATKNLLGKQCISSNLAFPFFVISKSYLNVTCTFRQELNISRICLSFCKAQSVYALAYLQHGRRDRILLKIICQTLYTRVTKVRQTMSWEQNSQ